MPAYLIWIAVAILLCLSVFFFLAPGYSFSAWSCLGLAGVVLAYWLLSRGHGLAVKLLRTALSTLLCLGILAAALTFAQIHRASAGDDTADCDYLVVLGAGVRGTEPSHILQNRIDAAVSYLTEHPDVICVVSGGKGSGEDISEAQCMFDHITAAGIAPDRVWMEDQSTSTRENLIFTLSLIEEKTGTRPEKLAVLSNEFHLYRAGLLAEQCGISIAGVPARTDYWSLRINYTLREIVAVWYYKLLGGN